MRSALTLPSLASPHRSDAKASRNCWVSSLIRATNGCPMFACMPYRAGQPIAQPQKQILDFDRIILAWHRSDQTSKRLNCIPGVGPLLATALIASVADPKAFRSGRNFSAWIGLVPKQHSSGGRDRLGMAGHRPRCNQLWGRAEERRSHAPNNVIDQPRQIPPEPDVHSKGHSESDWGAVHRHQT